ncbi:MAG: hypothetical protein WKG07_12955 [Hymenobacter sp.]
MVLAGAEYTASAVPAVGVSPIACFQVMAYRKRLSRDKLVFDDELVAAADGRDPPAR